MIKGLVSDIQRFSIHDGPGIRTIVFLKGCPLNCLWCSNPETQRYAKEVMYSKELCLHCQQCVDRCKNKAIRANVFTSDRIDRTLCSGCGECVEVCPSKAMVLKGRWMTVSEVIDEAEKDIPFYHTSGGGITISGGEPFFQPDFLENLLIKCKEHNLHTAVETTGCCNWEEIRKSLDYIDLFLFDIKMIDSSKHTEATSLPNDIIIDNLKRIAELNKAMIIRVPLIPQYSADESNLNEIGRLAQKLDIKQIHLLPYHKFGVSKYQKLNRAYSLKECDVLESDEIEASRELLEQFGLEVCIGGG